MLEVFYNTFKAVLGPLEQLCGLRAVMYLSKLPHQSHNPPQAFFFAILDPWGFFITHSARGF